MRRSAFVLLLALTTACGGSPVAPTPSSGLLAGTWRGTLALTPDGLPTSQAETTWVFTTIEGTGALGYAVTMQTAAPWFARTWTGTTTLLPPGAPPAEVHTHGFYNSPRGCQGSYYSVGQVRDAHHVSARFYGVDCALVVFDGTVDLTR